MSWICADAKISSIRINLNYLYFHQKDSCNRVTHEGEGVLKIKFGVGGKFEYRPFHTKHSSPLKGLVIFYFPGKDTFSTKTSKKEWVSTFCGIFFFPLCRKKKTTTIIPPESGSLLISGLRRQIHWIFDPGKKKLHSEKKNYRCSPKGVSECGKKKYSRKKKNTAVQQKEWVSGSSIFSREKKKYETFAPNIVILISS